MHPAEEEKREEKQQEKLALCEKPRRRRPGTDASGGTGESVSSDK